MLDGWISDHHHSNDHRLMNETDRPLLDREDAAIRVNVGLRTLDQMVKANQIPFIKLGPRLIRFCPDTLDAWVRDLHNNAPAK
jgi:excisionase family DNA binding protein